MGVDTNPAEADQLGGPEWLRDRRLAALDLVEELPEPSTELEEWRYGRIDDLAADRFSIALLPVDDTSPEFDALVDSVLADLGGDTSLAGVVVLRNGRVVRAALDGEAARSGVVFGALGSEPSERLCPPTVDRDALDAAGRAALGAAAGRPADRFAALNDALAPEPVVLSVPRGVVVDRPVAVISVLDGAAEGHTVLPRVSVLAGEDSEVALIEVTIGPDELDALVLPVTEVAVGRAARVRHSLVQDLGRATWQLGWFVSDVDASATLSSAVAALGGDYARLRLDCRLSGRGATGNLASVYLGDDEQTLDLRTFQDHLAPDTTSNLLFKGAVADRSHSVYTGLIRIHPDARGSNAFQTNRNLKLSEHAWAESVPNLEIENNDVHCSHASTVGPVDPDQRFYLECRGVPTEVADRLIVGGFFDEVLDDLPVAQLAAPVRRRISALLDRLVGETATAVES